MRTPTMPRFLLALTVTLTALIFALALTARAWGETQPPPSVPASLRGFVEGCEDKPPACWWGIVPGETTLFEAAELMARAGYYFRSLDVSRFLYPDDPVRLPSMFFFSDNLIPGQVEMKVLCDDSPCYEKPIMTIQFVFTGQGGGVETVRLVDFLNLMGPPSFVAIDRMLGKGQVIYADQLLTVDVDGMTTWDSPWRTSFHLVMNALNQGIRPPESTVMPWHGFLSLSQYCRREPTFVYCQEISQ